MTPDERREVYLAQVAERGHEKALKASGLTDRQWNILQQKPDFLEAVRAATGTSLVATTSAPYSKRSAYLEALTANWGNQLKARLESGLSKAALDKLRKAEPDFAEREADIIEAIVAEAEEQNIRAAVGADARTRDTGHLRWFLAHIRPEKWGDKPKEVHHHYSGDINITAVDEAILALTCEEGEIVE